MREDSNATATTMSAEALLGVTALIALAGFLVAQLAPALRVSFAVAHLAAEAWVICAVLSTSWFAPGHGERRLLWFVGLVACYAALLLLAPSTLSPLLMCGVTLAVLTAGGIVGGYVGSLLEFPGMLMVIAYVATLADIASVFHPHGVTAKVLESPRAMALLTLPFPILGTHEFASLVGIGDVAFASIALSGTRVTGLSARRTAMALGIAMAAVAICVEVLERTVPALPFLSWAVVLAHPEARKLPPDRVRRVLANLAFVTVVLGGVLLSAALHAP